MGKLSLFQNSEILPLLWKNCQRVRLLGKEDTRPNDKIKERQQNWTSIDWKSVDIEVSSLQRRIYRSSLNQDKEKVFSLQKILLNSRSAKLKAVRKVTQENRGKDTPGVDLVKSVPPKARFELAQNLRMDGRSNTIRRVYIPKTATEMRPLGIPTIEDRAKQALALLALEPE